MLGQSDPGASLSIGLQRPARCETARTGLQQALFNLCESRPVARKWALPLSPFTSRVSPPAPLALYLCLSLPRRGKRTTARNTGSSSSLF
jgi:hypothetical protein